MMTARISEYSRRLLLSAAVFPLLALACGAANAELPRRIGASLELNYFVLDSDFFGLSGAFGVDAALRYELASDIYFENSLGLLTTDAEGVEVNGLDWRLNLLALFPVLIPYRPVARLGIGVISVNPLTVTPTEGFRPTQTTFYLLGGAGVTRSIHARILVEASANFWITPYEYVI